ncbi:hypothetical protein SNE40_022028 [Patella caerulea]|uniref:Ig-like domain-containing protein n=1 Tax=Patella caerulea TaxID=87958 RepID=A0AAN8G925_PATCE
MMRSSLLYLTVLVWCPLMIEASFTWKETENPVKQTVRQRVVLVWKYETYLSINSMIFTRSKDMSDDKVPVGKWTQEKGFNPDPFISTVLTHTIDGINGTNETIVSLILEDPVEEDYDLHYNCQVNGSDSVPRNLSIELKALRPQWTDDLVEVEAREGEDAEFVWSYIYPFSAVCVFISIQSENEEVELGYWYQGKFIKTDPSYIDRVVFEKSKSSKNKEKIKVILKNVTHEDFNFTYVCRLILSDGAQITQSASLREVKVPLSTVSILHHTNRVCSLHGNAFLLLVTLFLNLDKTWLVVMDMVTQLLASKSEQNVEG